MPQHAAAAKPDQVSTSNILQRSRQLCGLRNSPQSTKAARPFAPASLGSLYSAATSMQVQAVTTKPHSAACRGPCRRRRSAVTAIAAPERPVVPPPEKRIPPPEVHSSASERCVCSCLGAWGCIHGLFDACLPGTGPVARCCLPFRPPATCWPAWAEPTCAALQGMARCSATAQATPQSCLSAGSRMQWQTCGGWPPRRCTAASGTDAPKSMTRALHR